MTVRSERVKCVDFHPTEPWVLAGLYSGSVTVWDYNSGHNVRTISASGSPIRCARFIARLNWIIAGSDDYSIRVFNAINGDRIASFDAHSDYIRCLSVHPTRPLVLSCSDDTTIKLWDWERDWKCVGLFEGHLHYVMGVAFNPRDGNTFASASLDRTIKVWSVNGGGKPNFTLEGHRKGLNAISYYPGDKPYLATGADDRTVRIWDYQGRACVKVLEGHSANVSCLGWGGASLPLLFTGSEDGTLKIWNANTLKCENTLKVGLDRVWSLSVRGNEVVLGCDEGTTVLRLGRSEPVACMRAGKILWVRSPNPVIMSANTDEQPGVGVKELGSSEVSMINQLGISASGRLLSVVGNEGDFVIYSTLAMRNKAFGKSLEMAWADNSANVGDVYATRDPSGTRVTVYSGSNFSELSTHSFSTSMSVDRIFGGRLLGIYHSSQALLSFYDWTTSTLVRTMEISVDKLAWDPDGKYMALVGSDSSLYILRFNDNYSVSGSFSDEEGFSDAFEIVAQFESESPKSLCWSPDGVLVFVQTLSNNVKFWTPLAESSCGNLPMSIGERQYLMGVHHGGSEGQIIMYLLDQDTFKLDASRRFDHQLVEFSVALACNDTSTISRLAQLDNELPNCRQQAILHFEKTAHYEAAIQLAANQPETLFRLLILSNRLLSANELLESTQALFSRTDLWQKLGMAAIKQRLGNLAEKCFAHAKDVGMLTILHVLSGKNIESLPEEDKLPLNLQFSRAFLAGDAQQCHSLIERTQKLPDMAIFSRAYGLAVKDENAKSWYAKNAAIDASFSTQAVGRPARKGSSSSHGPRDNDEVNSYFANQLSHVANAASTTSELDMLSVEVQTTGTGSLKGDDIELVAGSLGGPEPIPEEIIDDNDFAGRHDENLLGGHRSEDVDFVDTLEDPWKDV